MLSFATPLRRVRSVLLAILAFCVVLPAAARAQTVRTEVSPKDMTRILTSMGFEVEPLKAESAERSAMKFELGGYPVVLILANENTDAQLYAGFTGTKAKLDKVNQWNREKRFTRAYLDREGDPVLEADIDFTGGVTEANIKAWVKLYRDQLMEYARSLS
jgi:hypothetical protein